jgi:hypothetical protein
VSRRTAAALAVALIAEFGLAGQAPAPSSIFDFGLGFSEATVVVGDNTFRIYTNKRGKSTIALEPAMKDMGKNPATWPLPVWRAAAEKFVAPVGCGISDVVAIARNGGAWEATYVCPAGVDLKALIRAQTRDLQQGVPIHP